MKSKVIFLGTAGGRVVTFNLIRRSGGFLVEKEGSYLHVDPGPGAFVYLRQLGINYRLIDLIVLSHLHLDHSADVNSLLEASTNGGKFRNVSLFAPRSAIVGPDRVVYPYLRKRLVKEEFLSEGSEHTYKHWKVKALIRHRHHGVETYGLLINDEIAYVSCAGFEERMLELYPRNVKLMILNTTFYSRRKGIDHLSAQDALILLKELKPKRAVITHFSMEMIQKNPKRVAEELSRKTGVEVIPASDNMILELK
ncbi:MAG: MBL fold metallo-hydrolase [Aquificae bacterium]|nr:MBL fold metallo-hydrolase [Aquificota bacterium]